VSVGEQSMKDVSDKNFGVIIAFLLPGSLFLWGLSYSSTEITAWLSKSSATEGPNVGGFLYATLASLALGLIISAIRWLIIDWTFHHVIGPSRPVIDFGKLKDKNAFVAFQGVVENHYRYYQYYSNTLVALMAAMAAYLESGGKLTALEWAGVISMGIALLFASRDCLQNYYARAAQITA
jgi:hypothetical protein